MATSASLPLKRRSKNLDPLRDIEDSLRGGRPTAEARPRQEPVALARTTITTHLPSLSREQQGDEWRVVQSKKQKRRKREGSRSAAENQVNVVPPTKGAQPGRRANYTSEPMAAAPIGNSTKAPKGVLISKPRKVLLPRLPRSSAVTLTLSEGAKASYVEVIKAMRGKIPLAEDGIESVRLRKAMTGGIIVEVPGDKDRGKASTLTMRLAQILDSATVKVAVPARMAELRVVGFDVSVDK
jgi:hypothetical protein